MSRPDLLWLDLETSGLDSELHAILEVAVCRTDAEGRRILSWHTALVQPHDGWIADPRAMAVHGIVPGASAKPLDAVLREVSAHAHGAPYLAGHNVRRFDGPWLRRAYERAGVRAPDLAPGVLDTLDLARDADAPRPHSLTALCAHYGIAGAGSHRALADVRATLLLYRVLRDLLAARAPRVLRCSA